MKEMMKQKMMNRFHKRNSSTSSSIDFKSGEKLDFKFSSLQALQVPAEWDKLTLSLIAVETDKTVTKTGKASVWNGNCRWTESLLESIWVSPDDSSKEVSQYLYKLLISKASTRSGILGEVTVNLSNYLSSETCLLVALPLQKCDHGTILQVAIQCLTPRTNLRWSNSKTNSITEDVNSDLSDLDNVSDAPNGTNITNLGSSVSNSILDTSRARGPGSRGTSSSSVRSHHSFDSMDDSFGRESSHSNLSENAIDLINNKPESSTSTNVYDSPRSNRSPFGSGKNLLNKKQDSGKISHTVPLSPLRTFKSSEFILESESTTPEELRAEARTWERNARKLKVDLDLSRNETINQTKNLENATLQLSALQKECDGLKDEIKHLKIRLGESEGKERDSDNLKIQVKDKNNLQAELEEEIKFQKDLNYNLSLQLNKTQDSNLELVSILQELEETIEKQKLDIENLTASEPARESNDSWQFQESQKLESTILNLEKTLEEKTQTLLDSESEWKKKLKLKDGEIFNLEKTLEEKTQTLLDSESEWKKELKSKDDEIFNLEAKLSEAAPVLKEPEFQTIETSDLVEELKEKILELEKDCNELTDENLQLIFKLKESSKHLSNSDDFINSSLGEQPTTESTGFEESKKMNSDETDVGYLQIRCKDFENKCMDLESEVERYKVQEKEQENEIAELNRLLKSRLEEQQTHSFNQDQVNGNLENLIMELESKIEGLHEELLTKTSEIEDLKLNCLIKEEEIKSQNHSKKDSESRFSDLQIVNSQLGDSLILLQKEVNDTKNSHISEIKTLEKKLQELESHNQELEQESGQNSESEIIKLKTEIERLENEVQDMQNRWLESQQECEYLKKENPELESTTENVMEEYSQLQKSNRELRSQRLELNNRCTVLEAKLRDSEDNLLKFSKNFENLEERLSLTVDEIASKEGIFNSEIDGLDLQFKEHVEKCVNGENLLNKLYSEKVADKDKMVNLISELEEKVKLSEEKLETVEIDYEKLMELLENTRSNEEKLKNTVGEMSANLKSCEYKVMQLTEENSTLELQVQKLQDEIVSLEKSLNDLKYENERLEASLQEKVTNMQKAVVELEDYKSNKIVLEEKILQLQEQNKDLKTEENEDTKLTEDAEVDESSRMKSLEMALAEALESNEMYKGQLKSFLAEEQSVQLEMKKEEKLEAELNELQERYLNMSLKYAEVEAQREELVLKLKAVGPARGWFS